MGILLAFAPFAVFAVLDRVTGPVEALAAGAAVSGALIGRDLARSGQGLKVLELGTFALFGGLALYALLSGAHWSVISVRLCVDAGLLLLVLLSMAIRRPFTLQYAREQIDRRHWDSPEFRRTNYVITAGWAAAFAVLVLADIVLLCWPELPPRYGVAATILALVAAIKFTAWYPGRDLASAGR